MKKILLATAVLLAATVFLFSFRNDSRTIRKYEDGDKADATGMANYLFNLMKDPATGKMDYKAYYAAMQQFKMAMGTRSTNLGLQWNFIGPDNIGGRTRSIVFDVKNPSRVFAAGVSGGLWISNDGGQSWTKWGGSDTLENMNIVCMAQDDSGNIYFGTGEALAGSLLSGYGNLGGPFVGDGMWKSTDDGNTFQHMSSTIPKDTLNTNGAWTEVNRIAINPHSPDSVIIAMQSGGGINGGIKVSGDGGNTWISPTGVTAPLGTDVKFSVDGKYVFAAANSNAGIDVSTATFYYSSNGGRTFTKENGLNGFPKTDEYGGGIARIEFAVSPTNPNYAYAALVNLTGSFGSIAYVMRTRNGGASWDTIGTGTGFLGYYDLNGFDPTGPQGTYDLVLAVSPIDTNTVFVGGTTLWRWTPTQSWQQIDYYGSTEFLTEQHADMHALVFDPTNTSRLVIGSDGGVSQTLNPYNNNPTGVLYSSLNDNYDVTQFYSVSADNQGHAFGGTQDNSNDYINYLGTTIYSANQVLGGDGAQTQIALSNNSAFYAGVPGSEDVYRSVSSGSSWASTFVDTLIVHAAQVNGVQFILPFNLWEDPDSMHIKDSLGVPDRSLMAVGIGVVPYSNGIGQVWVTPDNLNFGTSPLYYQLENTSGNPTAVKFSADGNILYVGTDAGVLYKYSGLLTALNKNKFVYKYVLDSANGKTVRDYNWNALDSGIVQTKSTYNGFAGRIISSISVDPNDSNRVVVTAANYGDGYTTWIAKSIDATGGFDFISIQSNLPYGPNYSSCILRENGAILVGTQHGIWSSQNSGISWQFENDNFANVPVFGIKEEPYYGSYAIYVGSYGRGMWTSNTYTTGINQVNGITPVNNLTVFPNPLSSTGHVQYTLAKPGNVTIYLYDITGKLVKTIVNENMSPGVINVPFDVAALPSGTYIIDVIDGQATMTKKIAVLH